MVVLLLCIVAVPSTVSVPIHIVWGLMVSEVPATTALTFSSNP